MQPALALVEDPKESVQRNQGACADEKEADDELNPSSHASKCKWLRGEWNGSRSGERPTEPGRTSSDWREAPTLTVSLRDASLTALDRHESHHRPLGP